MATANLTAQQLRELLSYNPETGAFAWLVNCGFNRNAGKPAGGLSNGYVSIRVAGRAHWAHRLAWLYVTGEWPPHEIDHRNGVKTDNRLANLRAVGRQANQENVRMAPRSKRNALPLGVHFNARKLTKAYSAHLRVGGKPKHLGYFDTATEAHGVYLAAKRQHHVGCTI